MQRYPNATRDRVGAIVPIEVGRALDAFGRADRRSRSSAVAVLLAEALEARGFAPESTTGALDGPAEGADTPHGGTDPLRPAQAAEAGR